MLSIRRLLPPAACLVTGIGCLFAQSTVPADSVSPPPPAFPAGRMISGTDIGAGEGSAAPIPPEDVRHRKAGAALRRWLHLTPAQRKASSDRGRRLAGEYRAAQKARLSKNPDEALAAALTFREWLRLPPELREIAGRPLSAIADVRIKPDCAGRAEDHPLHDLTITIGDERLTGAATSAWASRSSRRSVPVSGIVLDGVAVLHEQPVLDIDPDLLPAALSIYPEAPRGRTCMLTGEPWDGSTAALIGGRIHFFSSPESRSAVEDLIRLALEKPGPDNARPIALALHGANPAPAGDIREEVVRLASGWTESPKSVLGLVLHFPSRQPPTTPETLLNALTDVSGWLNQSSHGKTSLLAAVPPMAFELPRNGAYYSGRLNGEDELAEHAEQLAREAGYEPENYDIRIFLFPQTSFDWTGLALVGGEHQWLNGRWDTGLLAHEIGHNYGLYHAASWNASGGSILPATGTGSDSGPEHDEYGDPFTVMGDTRSYPAGEYHQHAMAMLNWITESQVATARTPGTYRLHRFDHPASSGSPLLAIRLDRGEGQSLWVGYRQRFPQIRDGVTLVWNYTGSRTRLLDLTPDSRAGSADLDDAALGVGSMFADPSGNLYVTPLATGGSPPFEWIDVAIEFEQPGNQHPEVAIQPVSGAYVARSPLGFSAAVSDPDGDALTWLWDFGAGVTSTETNPVVSFALGGPYTVQLTVSDGRGGVTTATRDLYLNDPLLLWSPEPLQDVDPVPFTAAAWAEDRLLAASGSRIFFIVAPPGEPAGPWTVTNAGLEVQGIAWRDGTYVAAGFAPGAGGIPQAAVATSRDGILWTSPIILPWPPLRSIAASPAGFLCAGDDGTLVHSADGTEWSPVSSGTGLSLTAVAFAGMEGVAVGDEEVVLRSPDGGLTWRYSSGRDGLDGWYWTGAAAAGDRLFVWDGLDLYVSSGDLNSWTKAAGIPPEVDLAGIVRWQDVFVAAGTPWSADPSTVPAMLLASTDGITWRTTPVAWPAAPTVLLDAGGTLRVTDRSGGVRRQTQQAIPGLAAVPVALELHRAAGAPAAPATIHIASTTEAAAGWTLSADAEWLIPAESTGVARLVPSPVRIDLHTEDLPPATHSANLLLSMPGGNPLTIPVTLHLYDDDHGNSPASATGALPGVEYAGRIEAPGDSDWFSFAIDRPGLLVVRTTGSLDTVGELHHSSGTLVASNDDHESDPDDRNFLLHAEILPGTWYVRVTAWENDTGSYRLIASFTPHGPPFRIEAVRIAPTGGIEATFPSVPGRTYAAETAVSASGPWVEVPGTSRIAEETTTTITAPIPDPQPRTLFLRIVTPD